MTKKIKIIIADDHPIFRKGLVDIIEQEKDIEISGQASNGEQAIELIKKTLPDIAILDINMPIKTGFDTAREISKINSTIKFVFLTMHDEQEIFKRALELKASGYLLKDSAAEDILECIILVSKGDFYFSAALSKYFMKEHKKEKTALENIGIEKLTPTEITILKLIADKLTSEQIANTLYVSKKTVENHRMNICNKLNLHGTNSLMIFAVENKNFL